MDKINKTWTFLEAYEYIKGYVEHFGVCEDTEELEGIRNGICVYAYFGNEQEIGYPFAGKLRWRTPDFPYPSVDEDLQDKLNEHVALMGKSAKSQ